MRKKYGKENSLIRYRAVMAMPFWLIAIFYDFLSKSMIKVGERVSGHKLK